MIHTRIRFLILATPLGIAGGALADDISPERMSVVDLKHAYIACERSVAGGPIPPGEIQHCSQIYEALKDRAFDNDWQRLRTWSDGYLGEGTRT